MRSSGDSNSINPGKLKSRITFQRNTPTRGTTGELIDAWADVVTVWADIAPGGGREFFNKDQRSSEAPYVFTLRYCAGLKVTDRILYVDPKNSNTSRYFNIVNINAVDEMRFVMKISAQERNEGVSDKG